MSGMVMQGWWTGRTRPAFALADPPDLGPHAPSRALSLAGVQGREVTYRILFDEYWPRVRRHIACYIDEEDHVDEIAAEVFVVAWRKLTPSRPMGLRWFLRVADGKVRDATRRGRSRTRTIEAMTRRLQPGGEPDPLELIALRQAIGTLTARERQVVVLTYWDALTAGEVGEVLRCSQAAVWTTLSRARRKLRQELEVKEDRQ